MNPIAPGTEPIQFVSMAVILVTMVFIFLQIWIDFQDDDPMWTLALPMLLWIIHSAIYYITLEADRSLFIPFDVQYTVWSSILRLHGYLTIGGYEGYRLYVKWITWRSNKKIQALLNGEISIEAKGKIDNAKRERGH